MVSTVGRNLLAHSRSNALIHMSWQCSVQYIAAGQRAEFSLNHAASHVPGSALLLESEDL